MIPNLNEKFLYNLLPQGVIGEDAKGLIEALVSGTQDRLGDLRSYASKLDGFWTPGATPDAANNVVFVDLTSDAGATYTRSLDIHSDTPAASSNQLPGWVAAQLGLQVADLNNIRYGYDALRAVNTSTLSQLAATVGAMLYQTDMLATDGAVTAAQLQLVETWFPRLKIKGTAQSFEVLGRALGFDDVRVTPLWTRLSPRVPNDIGSSLNDADFATAPDYFPQQNTGPFYDPFAYRDGPFFSWAGTVDSGTNSSQFYTQAVTGQNPWIKVVLLGSLAGTNIPAVSNGTVTHPATGAYALAGGAAMAFASVACPGSSIQFQAIAAGDAFNGLVVNVTTAGTLAFMSIADRLSSIKYRSSYFDLGLTANMDKIESIFSSRAATTNRDLSANPTLTSDGTAVSPYRPWVGGSIAVAQGTQDWLTTDGTNTTTVVARRCAVPAQDRQLDMASLTVAGVQVTQAFEEVRAATRLPRRSLSGVLFDNSVGYAPYTNSAVLFTTGSGSLAYSGSSSLTPVPDYIAAITATLPSQTVIALVAESNPVNEDIFFYRGTDVPSGYVSTGTYNFDTGSYSFNMPNLAGVVYTADWTLISTEIVRGEPMVTVKQTGTEGSSNWAFTYQARPEDQEDDALLNEVADDYPWRRSIVVGGELVELDIYQAGTELSVARQGEATAFPDQSAVDNAVFAITSLNSPVPRVVSQPRSATVADYQAGGLAVAYQGVLKSLSTLTTAETSTIRPSIGASHGDTETDYDVLFQAGYKLFLTGLAQGVLVADLPKFFGSQHRHGLVGWFPFNEHVDDDLTVVDHSAQAAATGLTGVTYANRQWDATRGWCLNMSNGTVRSATYPEITTAASASFWIKVAAVPAVETTVVSCAPLVFTLNGSGSATGYVTDTLGNSDAIGSAAVNDGAWHFVYLRQNQSVASFNAGTLLAAGTESSGTYAVAPGDPDNDVGPQVVAANGGTFAIHDLRIWNIPKSAADLDLVRYHAPTPTICTYRLGFMYTQDRQDKYGIGVLPSGWAYPTVLPAWYRRTAQGRVLRYDSMGSYTGESRFKEVGIGSQHPVPDNYALGQQFITVLADGTAPFSTDSATLPGWNQLWQNSNFNGNFDVLPSSGSTSTGIVPVSTSSGTSGTWPNTTTQSNPFQQYVFVTDNGSRVFQLSLDGSTDSTGGNHTFTVVAPLGHRRTAAELSTDPYLGQLLASAAVTGYGTVYASFGTGYINGTINPVNGTYGYFNPTTSVYNAKTFDTQALYVSDVPAGARTLLTGGGKKLVANPVTNSGTLVAYTGTNTTPPLYMYLESRVISQYPGSAVWTGGGNTTTPSDNAVDVSAIPTLVSVDQYGTWLNTPVLGEAGVLEFNSSGTLPAGPYRLSLVSGQVGQADVDFTGFSVSINLNDTVINEHLLTGHRGYNFSGTDTFDFFLNDAVTSGGYLLSFDWTNPAQDTSRGTKRQLAIYGYTLRRIATELFKVTATSGTTPTVTPLDMTNYTSGTTPGGWYAHINSSGVNASYRHEASIYPANDTVTASYPLGDTLTGLTNDRREDIIYTGTTVVVHDTGSFTFPAFGTLTVVTVGTNN